MTMHLDILVWLCLAWSRNCEGAAETKSKLASDQQRICTTEPLYSAIKTQGNMHMCPRASVLLKLQPKVTTKHAVRVETS